MTTTERNKYIKKCLDKKGIFAYKVTSNIKQGQVTISTAEENIRLSTLQKIKSIVPCKDIVVEIDIYEGYNGPETEIDMICADVDFIKLEKK